MKILRPVIILSSVFIFSLSTRGQNEETVSLFTIAGLSGTVTYFAENGKLLPQPKSESGKIATPSIIQAKTSNGSKTKYVVSHNTGTDEVAMMLVGQSLCFFSASDQMHSSLTVCLDRPTGDDSFLVIETLVRPNFLDAITSARVFYGKAKPTVMFASWLKSEGKR